MNSPTRQKYDEKTRDINTYLFMPQLKTNLSPKFCRLYFCITWFTTGVLVYVPYPPPFTPPATKKAKVSRMIMQGYIEMLLIFTGKNVLAQ